MAVSEQRLETDAEYVVIEFIEAKWQMPISPSERHFFVVILRGCHNVMMRATQVSRRGPLLWNSTAAMIYSFGQAACSEDLLRLSKYVGGPIFALHGSKAERHSSICKVILVWLAPGSTLAWVVWTNSRLSDQTDSATATIKEDVVEALSSETADLLGGNRVNDRVLRSYTGRAAHIAVMLYAWLTFVAMPWKLAWVRRGKCALNCICT